MADACCGPDRDTDESDAERPPSFWQLREVQFGAAAGLLLGAGLGSGGRVQAALFLGAVVVGGSTFAPEAVRGLVRGRLSVATLMTIAAIGAVILGELGEAASLAFLFSLSEALESFALARTRRGLRSLLSLVPSRVRVRRGLLTTEMDPGEVAVGDVLVVSPGERVATDGIVRAGHSALDLSAITGEAVPVEVGEGQSVLAASVNGNGVLEVEVTARPADSTLARVVQIVEEAQERKGSRQRLAERLARPLVPAILAVAGVVAVAGSLLGDPQVWLSRSLVVLVAAAPCALAISVPVAVVAAIGAATRGGALIKGGAALEALGEVGTIAFDKTGTLTRNSPQVVAIEPANGAAPGAVLAVAAALEQDSDHPLAAAILTAARPTEQAHGVQAVVGQGLEGQVGGRHARLGKPGFIDAATLQPLVDHHQAEGSTVVLVERNDLLLGLIAVRDEVRPDAAQTVAALRRLNVDHIAMLTGDSEPTAVAIAKRAGIEDVRSGLLPEDKARIVGELQANGSTAMVGDGINDAPALATARVGIAMGAAGSDVAIEAADVALMGQDLAALPATLAHARRAGRIMRQNLVLSALILAVLVPLAAAGVLGLAAVVATHELAEVAVIANGIRAGRRRL